MRRPVRASLVCMLAVLLVGVPAVSAGAADSPGPAPDAAAAALATTFTSAEDAWVAVRHAKESVLAAQAKVVDAKASVAAAQDRLAAGRQEHARLEESLTSMQQVQADRRTDVGQIAHGMYVAGGAPGQGLDMLMIPAGVSLSDVAATEAYFASTSNFLIDRAETASASVGLIAAKVEASGARLTALDGEVSAAVQGVADASGLVDQARVTLSRTQAAVDLYLTSLPVIVTEDSCSDPSPEQIAAAIYSQAIGLGLGEVAAFVAIGVGLGETGLQNNTDGDCWGGNCSNGRTSSRGVFMQFYSWPPSGTAWSGKPAPTGGAGTRFDQFNGKNAWGQDGWAVADPRMNAAMAANMFLLGPDYGSTMGLEDNALFQSVRGMDPMDLSSSQMVQIAQQVQQFPVGDMVSYEENMTRAADFYLRIKSGKIPVPAFQPPLDGMAKSATMPATRDALAGMVLAQHPKDSTDTTPQDGLMVLGDSLAVGVAHEGGVPASLFGGMVTSRAQVGVTTKAALDQWSAALSAGPHRVLVSLGSNDGGTSPDVFGGLVDRLMKAAGKDRKVYWFSQHYGPSLDLNQVLEKKAKQYGDRLTLVGVTHMLGEGGGYTTAADRYLHPSADGYAAMWSTARARMADGSPTSWMCRQGSVNPLAADALAFARTQFGKPYGLPEGSPPVSWDCSKLTGGSYNAAWIAAGRPAEYAYLGAYPFLPGNANSFDQYRSGHFEFVPIADAQPGDFIFFNGDLGQSADNPIDHVALILDPVTMMTAEAGSPVGSYSYASRTAGSTAGKGMAGFPKANGDPSMFGDPGWQPVAGRLIPAT